MYATTEPNPFAIPQLKPPGREDSLTPKEAKAWAESLPIANVGAAARQLYERLQYLNHVDLTPTDRFQVLESMHQPLRFVLDALESNFVGKPLPLTRRDRLIADLVKAMESGAALGYKIVLNHISRKSALSRNLLHRNLTALALQRGFYYLNRALQCSYQLYQPYPQYLWLEIHRLYRYAAAENLADKPLQDDEQEGCDHSSLSECYRRLLLFSLAGPYRLKPGEVKQLTVALRGWAKLCKLTPVGLGELPRAVFVVDSNSDAPPASMARRERVTAFEGWALETGDLARELRSRIDALNALEAALDSRIRSVVGPEGLSAEFLESLLVAWGMGAKRVAPRIQAAGRLRVVLGLDSIYRLLGGEEQGAGRTSRFSVDVGARKGERSPDMVDAHEDMEAPAWSIVEESELQRRVEEAALAERGVAAGTQPGAVDCDLLDRSNQGLQLKWVSEGGKGVKVGELVAASRAGEGALGEPPWDLGVVRWLKATEDGPLIFGVQVIPGDASPVAVRRAREGEEPQYFRGLLMSRGADHPDTLITAPFYADERDAVSFFRGGELVGLRLSRMIDGSSSFSQFQYKVISGDGGRDNPRTRETAPSGRRGEDEGFDSLWRML